MSEDVNTKFINKYVQVLKSKYDSVTSDLINMEVQLHLIRESYAEQEAIVQRLTEENEKLKSEKTKTTRSTKTKEESF